MGLSEFFKKYICCLVSNPKRGITYAWLISLVLVFVIFIIACVAAGQLAKSSTVTNSSDTTQQGFGMIASFIAVWTALLLVAISVIGTIIMRRFQTALAIGYFIGVIFMMTQQTLIVFAIFVERSGKVDQTMSAKQSQQALAVFFFFLFLIYSAFGTMLSVFRNDIIKDEVLGEDPDLQNESNAEELPPEYK